MSGDGIWYVKLADGDVERVTLDQLDEAFQKGQIDENTMVLGDGANQWMKLADLLGLSEAPAPVEPVQAPRRPAAVQPQAAPQQTLPAQPLAARPSPAALVPGAPIARSLRPVSVDLSADVDFSNVQGRKASRKRLVVGALGTVLVLGAAAFFVTKQGSLSIHSAAAPQVAAAAALPPPEPATPAAPATPTPPTPPEAAMAGPSSVMDPTARRLTDDQKKKLLEAEKASSKPRPKAHGGGGGGGGSRHTKEKSTTTFTTTGNKFDPLNSSL